ncbi:MAG TPA: lysylphosphatidylglycerol synthase transmembrane domain-containing protein [Myxococcaceae bacterium]|nr:lysylphosphatidylglycerol synthase transmembrane domain-containing protein [Myxococcaceae bacterium]
MNEQVRAAPPRRGNTLRSWLLGTAVLGGVVLVSLHWSEERDFAGLLHHARPAWLLVATLLQALTYLAQGGVWQVVLARTRFRPRLWHLYKMSLAKLFVDQAVPSAGVSGTLLIINGLTSRGVDRAPVMACVVVETITNFTAFVLALVLALALAAWIGEASLPIWIASAGFIAFSLGLVALLLHLARGKRVRLPGLAERIPGFRTVLDALTEAPPELARNGRILTEATGLNFAIHLLDAATLWCLLWAVGILAHPGAVFAAFMLSTLARTIGVLPGGFGTFDGTLVAVLNLMGIPVAEALSATLLFRGFSFFLPLVPGVLLSRAELRRGTGGTVLQPSA